MCEIFTSSNPLDILIGTNEHSKGLLIFENSDSWEICKLELLPQPKRLPCLSKAKLWLLFADI